ncbi:hypothetical protein DWZ50_18610 [Mediterraneibacter gnavus]|uniref:Uncharacterized protein n=1 Tax=Mediterraneibacter gnavus TaxID=33038 RepID=A0A415S1K9_MEDGN|nr:hypothetical protein DWZ50_18610 [Mediterraneibacter gnavus]
MVIGMIKDSQGMDEMKNPCLVLYVNLTEAISTDGLLLTDICKISFNGLLRKSTVFLKKLVFFFEAANFLILVFYMFTEHRKFLCKIYN